MSQEKLGEEVGDSAQGTVSDWENGKSEPNLATFIRLGDVLRVSPSWLAFGVGAGGKPDESDPIALAIIERHKHDRLFGYAFSLSAKMLAEERVDADLSYIVFFSQKIARIANGRSDDDKARELIAREIEKERHEFRTALEGVRKSRL